MKQTMAFLCVAAALGLVACSSDDDGGASSSSSSSSSGSSGTTSGLSAAYKNNCQRCHGATGEGGGAFPRIPGGASSEASFIARVRAGKGQMPAFSASQISDADLKADYLWLTTQR